MASNGGGGRVRVVARIKGSLNKDAEVVPVPVSVSDPWILVSRSDPRVKISFTSDRVASNKQSYEVDECYEEGVGNEELFTKEIKPLISGLFEGQNATVFAYGTRGSGKTYTLQGSKEEIGLAALTLESILPRVEEEGKLVNISVLEVCQDRIVDLLDSKNSEVSVFEDAQGKIRLKGLSKVKLNSKEELQRLYHNAVNTRMQKAAEPPHRSHIGCVLHIVTPQNENSGVKLVAKINFIDLASFEDSRRNSNDGINMTETTRIKKSLNAVHNVLYALNAKDRVPYRESKLTRMLQDSLGGSSRVLMVTCIKPSFCHETVQTVSAASRSCIAGFLAYLDSSKSGRSASKTSGMPSSKLSARTNLMASPQVIKSASKPSSRTNLMSPKVLKPTSASTARKHTTSHLSGHKASGGVLQQKGRKLFVEINQGKSPKQENSCTTSVVSSSQPEENSTLEIGATVEIITQPEEKSSVPAFSETESSQPLFEEKNSTVPAFSEPESSQPLSEKDLIQTESDITASPCAYKTPVTSSFLDQGNRINASPPLSARLRDLSNNLKSLCISTETNLKMTQDSSKLFNQVIHENSEPNTPMFQSSARTCDRYNKNASPWTEIKGSLVHESLKFLNSASKEELKRIKGIGEKRSTYILELRDESPEPFKELDDLKDIGLSEKQIKVLVNSVLDAQL